MSSNYIAGAYFLVIISVVKQCAARLLGRPSHQGTPKVEMVIALRAMLEAERVLEAKYDGCPRINANV